MTKKFNSGQPSAHFAPSTVAHAISSTPWWLSPDTRAILQNPLFSSSFFRDEGRPPDDKGKQPVLPGELQYEPSSPVCPSSPMSIDSEILYFAEKWKKILLGPKEKRPSHSGGQGSRPGGASFHQQLIKERAQGARRKACTGPERIANMAVILPEEFRAESHYAPQFTPNVGLPNRWKTKNQILQLG